jgi:hypothetical protein
MRRYESPPPDQTAKSCCETADIQSADLGGKKNRWIVSRIGQKRMADEIKTPANKTC